MQDFFLFEAGATKTDVIFLKDGEKQEKRIAGYNPNRENPQFREDLKTLTINDGSRVYFYGSGLGRDQNKQVVRSLFTQKESALVRVYDDILAAARAAFAKHEGLIAICGTGGLAAWYDGIDIIARRGGHGYLIDDLGGGFELGKRLIAAWLNDDLSEEVRDTFEAFANMPVTELLHHIYKNNDLDLIASFSKLSAGIADESIQKIAVSYFEEFIQKDVYPLAQQFQTEHFSVSGSVGTGFHKLIRSAANTYDLKLDQVIESPIKRLLKFHMNQA